MSGLPRLVPLWLSLCLPIVPSAGAAEEPAASPLVDSQANATRAEPAHREDEHGHEGYVQGESAGEHDAYGAGAAAHAHELHEDGLWHRLQDWVIGLLGGVHPHDEEEAEHAHIEPITLTHFTDATELYLESPPLVAGEPAELLAHLTALEAYEPIAEGSVSLRLSGGGAAEEVFDSRAPSRPGLFRIAVTPRAVGRRQVTLSVTAPGVTASHDLGEFEVFSDRASARGALPGLTASVEGVVFLKEQQWHSDFAPAQVRRRLLRGSVPATGTLRATADGEAHVTAPSPGHLTAATSGFPYTGMQVARGQILAYVSPLLGGDTDVAGLELAVTRSLSSYELASQERRRLEELLARQAVPRRRVLEARGAEEVARAELEAARRRLAQVTGGPGGEEAGVPVRAPISGAVALVNVAPGGFVEQGERLFHLVNRDRLWLEARVSEADLGRIRQPQGAWFHAQGFDQAFNVEVGEDARLVAFGAMVDPVSRTVPVVFEFPSPDERLRVGLFVSARVYTGEEQEALAVPAGALVNDAGAEVVYVQRGGERFERRIVRTGLRDGDFVAVTDGLAAGERVVSRGAYLVHLAAGAPAEIGHEHAH